jgi:hypothetical protein
LSATGETEAGLQIQGQPGLHSKTLAQKKYQKVIPKIAYYLAVKKNQLLKCSKLGDFFEIC